MADRQVGTVKWFNETKGFGFIAPDDGTNDIFVHISEVQSSGMRNVLNEGDRVEFSVEQGPKGLKAIQVAKV